MKLEQLLEGVPFTLVQGSLDTEVQDITDEGTTITIKFPAKPYNTKN